MKYVIVIALIGGMSTSYVRASELSACHANCFESKAQCNAAEAHSFNACHEALTACKMSCVSGRPHKSYHASPLLNVAFNPLVESEIL